MASIAVIIPAAGSSSRFGGREKKPFVNLDGRPMWQRAAELFWNRDDVVKTYIVISPDDRESFLLRYSHLLAFTNAELVDGGTERFESVANALARVSSEVEIVVVHDAARPLTPPAVVESVIVAAAQHGAAIAAIPLADTLKRVDPASNAILETVPRAQLYQAQTPQAFRRDRLVEAYAKRATLSAAITDDAQLLEALGHPVQVVPGSPINFKITTPDDRTLAEAVLASRSAQAVPKTSRPFDDEVKW